MDWRKGLPVDKVAQDSTAEGEAALRAQLKRLSRWVTVGAVVWVALVGLVLWSHRDERFGLDTPLLPMFVFGGLFVISSLVQAAEVLRWRLAAAQTVRGLKDRIEDPDGHGLLVTRGATAGQT